MAIADLMNVTFGHLSVRPIGVIYCVTGPITGRTYYVEVEGGANAPSGDTRVADISFYPEVDSDEDELLRPHEGSGIALEEVERVIWEFEETIPPDDDVEGWREMRRADHEAADYYTWERAQARTPAPPPHADADGVPLR